ncbi:MAG: BTAD domain-containing putative transcriptional regulator, partial [Gemmatimonadota bacterium]
MPTNPPSSAPTSRSDGPLTLVTLGEAAVVTTDGDGLHRTLIGAGKSLALITYLRLTPGHSATRDTLIGLLWSDLSEERARHALRQTVWQLRQLLGDAALSGKDELVLELPLGADRDDLLAAVERRDLDAAVAIYRGPFLPGFAAPGGVAFEHWADLERDRLRGIFLRCSEALVKRKLAASEFREAQKIARKARDLSDRSELGWRLFLESLTGGRDFLSAAIEADALETWADAEGITLEPATHAAVRAARQVEGPEPAGGPSGFVAELIGREREFSAIVERWEAAKRAPAQRVRIEAAAGLGKTRLLQDLAARLTAGGNRVVFVRANMGE